MKSRILQERGRIRYFRDDGGEVLWRWQFGKMMRINDPNDRWRVSVRLPHAVYDNNWREITFSQAKRSFGRFLKEKEKQTELIW